MDSYEKKTCENCSELKPVIDFRENKKSLGGFVNKCIDCEKPQTGLCRKCKQEFNTEEFVKDKNRAFGFVYVCKPCMRADAKRWNEQTGKWTRRLKKYGLSKDDFIAMLKKQNNSCAICETDNLGFYGEFHVDHNHLTGEIRGLLCPKCNVGIGAFKDNIATIEDAINYLERTEEWNGEK